MAKEDIKDIEEQAKKNAEDVNDDQTNDGKKESGFTKVGNFIGSHIGGWALRALWCGIGIGLKVGFDYAFGGNASNVNSDVTGNVVDIK